MKRMFILAIAWLAIIALCAAASAAQNEELFGLMLENCVGEDGFCYLMAANGPEDVKRNGKTVAVGAVIDGWDVDWSIIDYFDYLGVDKPYTAETLLINFPIPRGDSCWTEGVLADVDYRYGVSSVRLIGSCLVSVTETYDGEDYDTEATVYEFEITTGSKVFDLVVCSDGGPALIVFLRPGSDRIETANGSTDVIGERMIGNCNEWVSLRAEPDTKSDRIRKVYLYSVVLAYGTRGEFTACNVDGVDGWIQTKYLTDAEYMSDEPDDYMKDYLRKHDWRG